MPSQFVLLLRALSIFTLNFTSARLNPDMLPPKEEGTILVNNLLLRPENDEHDILNEFLDQRVFDSLSANTPENGQLAEGDFGDFHSDLYLRIKSEVSLSPHHVVEDIDFDNSNLSELKFDPSVVNTGSESKHDGDYLYVTPNNGESNSIYASPRYSSGSDKGENGSKCPLDEYNMVRKELSNVKFGNVHTNPCPPTVDISDSSYLNFSPNHLADLPYSLKVLDLPPYSRVETQIKLKFEFSPAPSQHLLHVSQDLIFKSKFCLQDPVNTLPLLLRKNMLFMDTYVLTADLKRSCNVCSRCIKREQKRALRSKNGAHETSTACSPSTGIQSSMKSINNTWADENMAKKAIIFNCKELMSFPPPSGLHNDTTKTLDFSARIICYCRHHKEQEGFKLLFVVKDYEGTVVAKHLSDPIMIMDRKKTSTSLKEAPTDHLGTSSRGERLGDHKDVDSSVHPLSPNSIDDSTSEALCNTDTNTEYHTMRGSKRKKLSFDDSYNAATNPMFNGGFSPLSNSDTNASIHNMNGKTTAFGPTQPLGSSFAQQPYSHSISRDRLLQQLLTAVLSSQFPTIQKVIPSQGPIRGGIEVTLLGFNFRPGLIVKFGSKNALATHCWSESTIVTYLPPASQPGQVLVSFENLEDAANGGQQLIFTYTDDTDRQLIELALQIVGLKMNGKLEDAKNIAKRIVGSDGAHLSDSTSGSSQVGPSAMNQANKEWYDNAQKAVEKLSRSSLSTEDILISFLSLVDLPNCPIVIPNWQLCNAQGQVLLHLATIKGYEQLVRFLITHGCKIDIQDNQELTPLFIASMNGNRDLIDMFIECKSNWNMKLKNGLFLKDYCDPNVLDIFDELESAGSYQSGIDSPGYANSEPLEEGLSKSISVDSLNSLYMIDYGRHISRMVAEVGDERKSRTEDFEGRELNRSKNWAHQFTSIGGITNDSSDFADSEYDTEDDDVNEILVDQSIPRVRMASPVAELSHSERETEPNELPKSPAVGIKAVGLWQKMKSAVFSSDTEADLPTYDDLFPFGSSSAKHVDSTDGVIDDGGAHLAKTFTNSVDQDDIDVTSDSSEDMVINYVNHPRKAVENDKMLLFFWLPVLISLIGLFSYVSITGYQIKTIEVVKEAGRNAIGSMMVGNERLSRVFSTSQPSQIS